MTGKRYGPGPHNCTECGLLVESVSYWDALGLLPFCSAQCLDSWRGDQ